MLMLVAFAGGAAAEDAHLPFFHANRDWILRAYENLPRPSAPADAGARAWSFDPFADASAAARLAAVRASLDSATTLSDLGTFRSALDSLLATAVAAGARLDDLDLRFAAHLRTALEVTLASREKLALERVETWLDGVLVHEHTVSEYERAALAAGGVLEVLRRVVEPRPQALEVRAWTRGDTAPSCTLVTIEPTPDVLTICHLDLDKAGQPARSVRATLGGQ
jgi:hypothetical protein